MKYVILIHSNPEPLGHPTGEYTPEFMALPQQERDEMNLAFDGLLAELGENG